MTREEGKLIIEARVEEFRKNEAILKKKGHGETNIRTNYIDVLFEALGWNMKSHHEVVREYSQKDNAATKKVDYAFKVNGKLKFFVEAKEASVDLVNNKEAIYQAKRYAYSTNGRAPIVILTDFEEFRVFNILKAPKMDTPELGLLKERCMIYGEYAEKWDILWDTFSKEAVSGGSLDVLRGKVDKNTKLMDAEFLDQITDWRETLAKNIALRNADLNEDEINEAVQRILDRLLFIRNLEDRQIEPENMLLELAKSKDNIYAAIVPLFRKLDGVYNGLLFKDHFSEKLSIDDKTLATIIKNMSYPLSPFQFDVIEPEILGRIYEKFLGSKIRLTENHHAKVEEKLEVRKAGGVYYTPEYIVNYIVENTVGKKIEGLSPEEIKAIKIVDPACGSGSFLLGAFSYLLDYHTKWYSSHKSDKKYKSDYYIADNDELKITLDKRADILKNNIFGVDIDQEATEVAIMSLYLKMLDEGYDLEQKSLFFGKGHLLPDMMNNVKCGNSLIGTDYFEQKAVDDESVKKELFIEMKEIKPFDWKDEFSDIFKNGGFDCVVGNPPWGADLSDLSITYLIDKYSLLKLKNKDSYFYFVLEGITLIKTTGSLGLILPNTWLLINNAASFRDYILKYRIKEIIDHGDGVFKEAIVESSTLVLEKILDNDYTCHVKRIKKNKVVLDHDVDINLWLVDDLKRIVLERTRDFNNMMQKMKSLSENFGDNCEIIFGIKPYQVGHGTPPQTKEILEKRIYHSDTKQDDFWKPLLIGSDVKRYFINFDNNQFIKYGKWLMYPSDEKKITGKKILLRRTSDKIIASYDTEQLYPQNSIFIITSRTFSYFYLLGILNSKLMNYVYIKSCPQQGKIFAEVKPSIIKELPIRVINSNNKKENEKHNEIEILVDQMLQAQKEARSAKSDADKKLFEKSIAMLDRKIDSLVYQLYDLTDEEIRIVEGV